MGEGTQQQLLQCDQHSSQVITSITGNLVYQVTTNAWITGNYQYTCNGLLPTFWVIIGPESAFADFDIYDMKHKTVYIQCTG